MVKHCCDTCGKTINKPKLLDGHSDTNLMFRSGAYTIFMELCDDCLRELEDRLSASRKEPKC